MTPDVMGALFISRGKDFFLSLKMLGDREESEQVGLLFLQIVTIT
jgi:hypothetical protein